MLGLMGNATTAGDAAAASEVAATSSNAASSSSSSANKQVKWSYLLRLQQSSPRWAAAVAEFDASGQN
jgi:hypothetical protein